MNRHLTFILIFFTSLSFQVVNAQTKKWKWFETPVVTGSLNPNDEINIIADEHDNVYVVGSFLSEIILPGRAGNIVLNGNAHCWNAYIAKYDTNGKVIWAKSIFSQVDNFPSAISLDKTGHLYFNTSSYAGSMDSFSAFVKKDSFVFSSKITFYDTFGNNALFLASYDTSGNPLWVKMINGKYIDHSTYFFPSPMQHVVWNPTVWEIA